MRPQYFVRSPSISLGKRMILSGSYRVPIRLSRLLSSTTTKTNSNRAYS